MEHVSSRNPVPFPLLVPEAAEYSLPALARERNELENCESVPPEAKDISEFQCRRCCLCHFWQRGPAGGKDCIFDETAPAKFTIALRKWTWNASVVGSATHRRIKSRCMHRPRVRRMPFCAQYLSIYVAVCSRCFPGSCE